MAIPPQGPLPQLRTSHKKGKQAEKLGGQEGLQPGRAHCWAPGPSHSSMTPPSWAHIPQMPWPLCVHSRNLEVQFPSPPVLEHSPPSLPTPVLPGVHRGSGVGWTVYRRKRR